MASDRHMESARELFRSLRMLMPDASDGDDVEHELLKLATALANAERDGLRRAAEKNRSLAAEIRKQSGNDVERCLADALETAAAAILSQAGEGSQ